MTKETTKPAAKTAAKPEEDPKTAAKPAEDPKPKTVELEGAARVVNQDAENALTEVQGDGFSFCHSGKRICGDGAIVKITVTV